MSEIMIGKIQLPTILLIITLYITFAIWKTKSKTKLNTNLRLLLLLVLSMNIITSISLIQELWEYLKIQYPSSIVQLSIIFIFVAQYLSFYAIAAIIKVGPNKNFSDLKKITEDGLIKALSIGLIEGLLIGLGIGLLGKIFTNELLTWFTFGSLGGLIFELIFRLPLGYRKEFKEPKEKPT